jgi:hypothetical protein
MIEEQALLKTLHNELHNLSEIAGQLDADSNAKIAVQQSKVVQQIEELEKYIAYKNEKYLHGV